MKKTLYEFLFRVKTPMEFNVPIRILSYIVFIPYLIFLSPFLLIYGTKSNDDARHTISLIIYSIIGIMVFFVFGLLFVINFFYDLDLVKNPIRYWLSLFSFLIIQAIILISSYKGIIYLREYIVIKKVIRRNNQDNVKTN